MALLHASCLETWLTTSRREKCEICQSSFETIRVFPTFREVKLEFFNERKITMLLINSIFLIYVIRAFL